MSRTGKKRWRRLRLQVFHEVGWRCEKCGKTGALECDHIQPLRAGGEMWSRSNLQALCRDCHIRKTGNEHSSPETLAWREYLTELAGATGLR